MSGSSGIGDGERRSSEQAELGGPEGGDGTRRSQPSDGEVEAILADGFGLSSWMAGPAEMQAAALMAAGEPMRDSCASVNLSWKRWAGRKEGASEYQVGDLARGILTGAAASVAGGIKDAKHSAADAKLFVKEKLEKHAREKLSSLLPKVQDRDGELEDGDGGPQSEEATLAFAERWWYEACQAAHRSHDPQADPKLWRGQGNAEGRGHLEVSVLSVGVERTDAEPLCQLSLERKHSGALRPIPQQRDDASCEDDEERVSAACFAVQEVSGCDLRINVFNKASPKFQLGFEDSAFCGGAFLPLRLVAERGALCREGLQGQPPCISFAAQERLQLLPLELLRVKRKLEPAGPAGGAQRPERALGHVLLAVRLTLYWEKPAWAMPLSLQVAEHFLGTTQQKVAFQNLTEPLAFAKEAAATLDRVKRALVVDLPLGELREDPLVAAVMQVWWLYLTWRAPVWAWPPLLVVMIPVYALSLRSRLQWSMGMEPPRLFFEPEAQDTSPDSKKNVKERVQAAAKDVAQAQSSLRGFFLWLLNLAATVEKVKFVLAVGDLYTSVICLLLAATASCAASVAIVVFGLFCEVGGPRLAIWLGGSYWLLPARFRAALSPLGDLVERGKELQKRYCDDTAGRKLQAFWQRIPDAVEAGHLELCRREVLVGRQ